MFQIVYVLFACLAKQHQMLFVSRQKKKPKCSLGQITCIDLDLRNLLNFETCETPVFVSDHPSFQFCLQTGNQFLNP